MVVESLVTLDVILCDPPIDLAAIFCGLFRHSLVQGALQGRVVLEGVVGGAGTELLPPSAQSR